MALFISNEAVRDHDVSDLLYRADLITALSRAMQKWNAVCQLLFETVRDEKAYFSNIFLNLSLII